MRPWVALGIALLLTAMPLAHARADEKTVPSSLKIHTKQLIPVIRPIVVRYDVYVGGLHFIATDILFQEQTGKYHARVTAHTSGFWYKAFPWETMLEVKGTILKDRFVPAEFHTRNVWGKKPPKETLLHFDKAGNIKVEFKPPQTDDSHEQVTEDMRRGALDPVTALLQMLGSLAVENTCNVTVPVYDGKLLFNVSATDAGEEYLDDGDYGIFKGSARTCDANFKLVAGEWKEKVKSRFWKKSETEEGREPFHIWLGSLAPGMPEFPVRLETGSIWGLIMIHLSSWHYAAPDELKTDGAP